MNDFLSSNEPKWRLARTVVQGIIGVLIAALPQLVGLCELDQSVSAMIVAVVMAVLSPIMAMLGGEKLEE